MGLLFLIDEKENADPPTAVGWAWGFCLWGEKKLNRKFKAHGLRSMGLCACEDRESAG